MYYAHAQLLRSLGCNVAQNLKPRATAGGVLVCLSPRIVIHPSFATCLEDLRLKFPEPTRVKISARSTLVLKGANVKIRVLDLDGSLIIDASDGSVDIDRMKVRNEGVDVVNAAEDAAEDVKIRGFTLVDRETRVVRPENACVVIKERT